jgi:hypothetical protein
VPVAPARILGALMVTTALVLMLWDGISDVRAGPTAGETHPTPVAVANAGVPFVRFAPGDAAALPGRLVTQTDTGSVTPTLTLYQPSQDR